MIPLTQRAILPRQSVFRTRRGRLAQSRHPQQAQMESHRHSCLRALFAPGSPRLVAQLLDAREPVATQACHAAASRGSATRRANACVSDAMNCDDGTWVALMTALVF